MPFLLWLFLPGLRSWLIPDMPAPSSKEMIFQKSGSWVPEAYACNPSCLGGWVSEFGSLRLAQANVSWEAHLQTNQSNMDWRCGSGGRMSALQTRSSEFKTQSHQHLASVPGGEWIYRRSLHNFIFDSHSVT
jgi:hypothetical protein